MTGLILAKLDSSAKGGVVFSIAQELQLPIKFVGTGEKLDDLAAFDPQEFVAASVRRRASTQKRHVRSADRPPEASSRTCGGKGRLTEQDVDEALREVRLALLEADVNFKVARDFVRRVRERATGAEVLESLTPAQQVLKIVDEELVGHPRRRAGHRLRHGRTAAVMLVGLNGAGKTTSAAKLALHLRKLGQRPLLVACDTLAPRRRQPAGTLASRSTTRSTRRARSATPVEIAKREAVRPRATATPGHHRHRWPPADRRALMAELVRDQARPSTPRGAAGGRTP